MNQQSQEFRITLLCWMRCQTENFMRTKTSPDKYDSRMRETGNFVQPPHKFTQEICKSTNCPSLATGDRN